MTQQNPSFRGLIPGFEPFFFFLAVRGRQPLAQLPTWRARVSLLVWIIPFDLSGMGGSTSSYATAGIALRTCFILGENVKLTNNVNEVSVLPSTGSHVRHEHTEYIAMLCCRSTRNVVAKE
jgi:hypothetical protein